MKSKRKKMSKDKIAEKILKKKIGCKIVEINSESSDRDDYTMKLDDGSEIYFEILQAKLVNKPI